MPKANDYKTCTLHYLLEKVCKGEFALAFENELAESEQPKLLTKVLVGQHFGIVVIEGGTIIENAAEVAFLTACFFPQERESQVYYNYPEEITFTSEPGQTWIPFRCLPNSVALLKFQRALRDHPESGDIITASNTLARRYLEYALPTLHIYGE